MLQPVAHDDSGYLDDPMQICEPDYQAKKRVGNNFPTRHRAPGEASSELRSSRDQLSEYVSR